jgi:hypothetical protein
VGLKVTSELELTEYEKWIYEEEAVKKLEKLSSNSLIY